MVAARALGPTGRGELAAIQTWPLLLGTVGVIGLPEALVYCTARRRHEAGSLALTATAIALGSTLLFSGLGYAFMPWLLQSQAQSTIDSARVALLITPLFSAGVAFHALRGMERYGTWNALRVLSPVAWLLIIVVGGFLLGRPPSDLVFAYIIAAALLIIPYHFVVWRTLQGPVRVDPGLVSPLLRFGIPSVMTVVPQTLNFRLDQMFMIGMFGPQQLGIYVVAVTWSSLASPLVNSIAAVLFSRVAVQQDDSGRKQSVTRALHASILLGATGSTVMLVLTPWLLPAVLGQGYAAGTGVAQVLIVAGFVASLNLVLQEGLRGYGRPTSALVSEGVGICSTVGLLLILLGPFQLLGAAVASLLSYSVVFAVLVTQLRVLESIPIRGLLLPSRKAMVDLAHELATIPLGRSRGSPDAVSHTPERLTELDSHIQKRQHEERDA